MRVLCSLMFAAVALPAIAQAEAPPPTVLATVEAVAKAAGSQSLGLPWDGSLRQARLLRPSQHIRYLRRYASARNFWGTGQLVAALQRAAGRVAQHWPGSRLALGELSARRGGQLRRHHSHRNGRDVDIGFYLRHATKPAFAQLARFAGFGRRAPLPGTPAHVRFDDARNWSLVRSLLQDKAVRIQYMFVAKPVRARLLVQGRRAGASPDLLRQAAAVMVEPRVGEPHDDHLHVRIYCARHDRPDCLDSEPFWPWYDGPEPEAGYAKLPTLRWR